MPPFSHPLTLTFSFMVSFPDILTPFLPPTIALKARFRGQPTGRTSAPGSKTKNVAPFGGPAGAESRSSGTTGGRFLAVIDGRVIQIPHLGPWLSFSTDIGNEADSEEKLDKLEDFLDDLLG